MQSKGRRVVIFDCDGVMFDSRGANVAFYNKILAQFEKRFLTEDDTDIVHMYTGEDSVNYLFQGDPRRAAAQEYRKLVDYSEFIPLMVMEPFLLEVLISLRGCCHLGIATNRTDTIGAILNVFGLEQFFELVVCALDVELPKPDPEMLHKILAFFELRPDEAVYIGDMPVDEEVARAARVPFIAYKNRKLNADYHISDLRELPVLAGCG